MSYNIVFLEQVREEMLEAYLYYEMKSAGLGEQFLNSIEDVLLKLESYPHYFAFIDDKCI